MARLARGARRVGEVAEAVDAPERSVTRAERAGSTG